MAARFDVRATSESHFSWLRTRLSLERTLMSWVRTGTALIGFGFTIVTFFNQLLSMTDARPAVHPELSRHLGSSLIFSGVVALLIASWQYERMIRYLWDDEFEAIRGIDGHHRRTPLLAVAILLAFIGLCALVAVNVRLA
jgi:putative membrane protein